MINENTLSILNKYAFGANIDALESYIIDYEQASKLTNMSRFEFRYEKLRDLLSELKSDSIALTDNIELKELEADLYESAFNKYGNIRKCVAYGPHDIAAFSDIKEYINHRQDQIVDILAILNIKGLDVICTYKNGYLCKTYLVGESRKYVDITEIIRDKVPNYIKAIQDKGDIELRGKLTIMNDNIEINNSLNIETSIMHCIRCNIHLDKLDIIFNELLSTDRNMGTQWDRMDFLRENGVKVPHHCLIRSIDGDLIPQAIIDLDNYFCDIDESEVMYQYRGFEIRINDIVECSQGFIAVCDEPDFRAEFESTVKSIYTSELNNRQVLKIVNVNCNKRYSLDSIPIYDLYDFEKYNISLGCKVRFKIVEHEPILIDYTS